LSEEKKINLEDLLDVVQKKWYWITIPFFFFVCLGAWLFVVLPREYEATTVILIQPQEIPQAYVVATVSSGLANRVRTLSQEVMSRSNLEKIILEMDLYRKERAQGMPMDILVAGMRKHIVLDVSGGGGGSSISSFTLGFRGREPKQLADVTNRLASLFIQSNLSTRARQASETTEFLEKQLTDLRGLLEGYEKKVQEFRNSHMGALPEQLPSNTATLSNLQSNLESVQRSLADARNRKIIIQNQLSQFEGGTLQIRAPQRSQRLAELRQRLQDMKANYTPEYPEIKRLQEQIKEIENQPREVVQSSTDPRVLELQSQLRAISTEIASLESDSSRIKQRINSYQQRVESTPKTEQEITTLLRDYQITKDNYQKVLDRLYEARRAESLEKRQQGEQFRILDLAQVPQTPARPRLIRLVLVFLVLGLGSGGGLLLMIELLDNTVKGIQQVEELSGNIPCISAVPLAMTEADKNRSRRKTMNLIAANILVVILGLVIVVASRLVHLTVEPPFNLPF